jgi:hypothetical protein
VASLCFSTTSRGTSVKRSTDSLWAVSMHSYQLSNFLGNSTGGEQVKSKKEHTYIVSTNFN